MGFNWQQTISSGSPIESVDLQEIRNATDELDNRKCYLHYSADNGTNFVGGHDSSYWGPYQSTYNSSVYPFNNSTVYGYHIL